MEPTIKSNPDGSFSIKLDNKTTITTKKDPKTVIDNYNNRNKQVLIGAAAKYNKP